MQNVINNQFEVLKSCLGKIYRIVVANQFSLEESMKDGKEHSFTVEDVRTLDSITEAGVMINEGEPFDKEIKYNLGILQDPLDRKEYEQKLKDYINRLDRCNKKVDSLLDTLNDYYFLTKKRDGDGGRVTLRDYDSFTSPRRLAAAFHMSLVNATDLGGINTSKWIICNNVDWIYKIYYGKDITPLPPVITSPGPINNTPPYSWKGGKTDLAELVWALSKSGRITNTATGQPVTQADLTRQFETLFGMPLDVTGLMKGRMNTYRATSDGKTFTTTLQELVNERAASV